MKKITTHLLTLLLVFNFVVSPNVLAANTEDLDTVVSLQIDNPIMQINGASTEIDTGKGTSPIISNGRTLVPIRAIIEAFGGKVNWENSTRTVTLTMKEDVITLVIGSRTAHLNNTASTLDVSPVIINGRTMLPIRYIAESFNLGVAWENDTRTVFIIRNGFDNNEHKTISALIPEYSGQPYAIINNNVPFFKHYEVISGSFEFYAELDELGRCNVAMASVGTDIMPNDPRESISSVIPTGWINNFYNFIDGGYLYNRCHLIGYQLTGENSNKRNLITGTRYMNIDGMLSFENSIRKYVETTKNNVVYRATPIFTSNNLVADGILLEAYSVEDNGVGISFCVYCYNVQPDIFIDYTTGANSATNTPSNIQTPSSITPSSPSEVITTSVYRTPKGKKYHFDAECGGKNSYETTLEDAKRVGLTPCSKCAQ